MNDRELIRYYKNYRIEKVQHVWEDNQFWYNYMISAYSLATGSLVVFGYADTLKEAKKCIDTKNFKAY